MKTSLFLLACGLLVSSAVQAGDDPKMQVETDAETGAMVEPSRPEHSQGNNRHAPPAREAAPGVKPAAQPEPKLRQGPRGGTMVETPDYMRPQETIHLPGSAKAPGRAHE